MRLPRFKEWAPAVLAVVLTACGVEGTPTPKNIAVLINKGNISTLPTAEKELAEKQLDTLGGICAEVGADPNTANILQVASPNGIFGYGLCNQGGHAQVIQYVGVGGQNSLINLPLIKTENEVAVGFGYLEGGESHYISVTTKADKVTTVFDDQGVGTIVDAPEPPLRNFGVISVAAEAAWTDTPAPTGTITAEFGSVVTNTPASTPAPRETSTSLPTAESPYTAEKIGFIPKNESQVDQCVRVADPIKEPAKFTADINSVITAAQPLINAYNGPFLQNGGFGANGMFLNVTQDMGVVGCISVEADGGAEGKKIGVGLVIPFLQPDGTKTAIVGIVDPFQKDLAAPGKTTTHARTTGEILDEISRTGKISPSATNGSTMFDFTVDPKTAPGYYSEFSRDYLAIRNYSADYMNCTINRKNISGDVRALLLTMVRKK